MGGATKNKVYMRKEDTPYKRKRGRIIGNHWGGMGGGKMGSNSENKI